MNRRGFLQQSLAASLIYGSGALPRFINESSAAFQPLGSKKVLLNLMMNGGPDMRHMIAPPYSANSNDFGYHYWRNRTRSHGIANTAAAMQAHWDSEFDHRTYNGVNFGIAKSCGWFTQMWDSGNVAIICNAYGIESRDHSHAVMVLNQGNRTSLPGQLERSGWGGRLAVASGNNSIGLTDIPSRFCFGPDGSNINAVDNSNLISVADSRTIGFFEYDQTDNARSERRDDQAARAAKSYYKTLHAELEADSIYQRFLEHESKLRLFGSLIQSRLATVPIPPRIQALYDANVPGIGNPERLLSNSYFGRQIRNAFDTLASHDLLDARVASMEYGGWDSHADQADQINDNFSDLFGVDRGFSALWESLGDPSLGDINRENLVILTAGEFGRQIRDNGGNGTDHGEANMLFLFGEKVTGGIYGELFPGGEIVRIQDQSINTPDIIGLTQFDHPFAAISEWVTPGSSPTVFPNQGTAAIEQANMFAGLLSS